jgi:hypothetical protein
VRGESDWLLKKKLKDVERETERRRSKGTVLIDREFPHEAMTGNDELGNLHEYER